MSLPIPSTTTTSTTTLAPLTIEIQNNSGTRYANFTATFDSLNVVGITNISLTNGSLTTGTATYYVIGTANTINLTSANINVQSIQEIGTLTPITYTATVNRTGYTTITITNLSSTDVAQGILITLN